MLKVIQQYIANRFDEKITLAIAALFVLVSAIGLIPNVDLGIAKQMVAMFTGYDVGQYLDPELLDLVVGVFAFAVPTGGKPKGLAGIALLPFLLLVTPDGYAAERTVTIDGVAPTQRAPDADGHVQDLGPDEIALYKAYAFYCDGSNNVIESPTLPVLDVVEYYTPSCEVTYYLTAVDTQGQESDPSNTVPLTLLISAPNPPSNVTVTVTVTVNTGN